MSEGTTNPNGSSKRKELKRVDETPEQIEQRISQAGYGNLTIRRVTSVHAVQFEVSDDREKNAEEEEKKGIINDFMRAGNQKKKVFNPVELAREAMVGKVGTKSKNKDKKPSERKRTALSKDQIDKNKERE